MNIWNWRLRKISRALWLRASIFSLIAVFVALFANHLGFFIPDWLPSRIGADSVQSILTIIASSMLAVTTFSLTAMVGALVAATQDVTPRAARLLMADKTTHNVLSTFLGAFLFSLVGLIALGANAYNEQGRAVLFGATIVMIAVIVATLLRWIEHLSAFGRLVDTTQRVEIAATESMRARKEMPYLGGVVRAPNLVAANLNGSAVHVGEYGYVQHIDMVLLGELCEQHQIELDLFCLPGSYVGPGKPVAIASSPELDETCRAQLAEAFEIDHVRIYDQDPRFGVCVLTEIASRALSPAINDPGTAIDVLGRHVRILATWSVPEPSPSEPVTQRVRVPDLKIEDLFDDAFRPIARDGAHMVEIQIRLQKALAALAATGEERYRKNARRISRLALERARLSGMIDADLQQVQEAAMGVA